MELELKLELKQNKQASYRVWWIALGAAMWGLDGVFIVALLHYFSSVQIVLIEHLLLMLFSIPILIYNGRELRRLNLCDWLAVLFIAWGGSALASILFTVGFHYGNVNIILILQKLQPIFAVLLAAWILKERVQKTYWVLLAAALVGAYLLTFGFHMGLQGGHRTDFAGALCALGAAILWGGSTVMGKRLVGKLTFTTVTALRFALALPLLMGIVLNGNPNWIAIRHSLTFWPVWMNLLFQTLVPSLISLLVYYWGLNAVKASHATLAELAFPATGLLLNWLILRETITFGQWIGFAIIWIAVMQLSRTPTLEIKHSPQRQLIRS